MGISLELQLQQWKRRCEMLEKQIEQLKDEVQYYERLQPNPGYARQNVQRIAGINTSKGDGSLERPYAGVL